MSEMKWIPVTERLPEKSVFGIDNYLVTVNVIQKSYGSSPQRSVGAPSVIIRPELHIAVWAFRNNKWDWDVDVPGDVVAWMPSPEPYKEEQNEL